jgi:hypothetical protein
LGAALATAIALSLKGCASAPVESSGNDMIQVNPPVNNEILCYGVNSCKGQGACKMVTSTCRSVTSGPGSNSCQGKGGVYMHAKECQSQGGIVPQVPIGE